MENIISSYEKYQEENRLTLRKSRRIEFITTIRILDKLLGNKKKLKILDCAAGTGIYSFYFADKGHIVTATDITPRHIDYINNKLKHKNYNIDTKILNAINLEEFKDESFDVVLNMGPFYHLTEEEDRSQNIEECLRVLHKGGLLVTSYIPRYFIFQYIALQNKKYLDINLANQILETGVVYHTDKNCFWTDTYYSTSEEIEDLYKKYNLSIINHFAQDGISPQFGNKIDSLGEEEFGVWCEYHYKVCREKSILGASNHVIIIGQK